MTMNESVIEFLNFSLLSYLHRLLCKSWRGGGVVMMVGSCGGTDSGTNASPPSYCVFPLSLNVVNECCMKSLRPAILLEIYLAVCPESSYYYYYYYPSLVEGESQVYYYFFFKLNTFYSCAIYKPFCIYVYVPSAGFIGGVGGNCPWAPRLGGPLASLELASVACLTVTYRAHRHILSLLCTIGIAI